MCYCPVAGGVGSQSDVVGRLFNHYFGSNGHGGDGSEVGRGRIDVLGSYACTVNQQDGGRRPSKQPLWHHSHIFQYCPHAIKALIIV